MGIQTARGMQATGDIDDEGMVQLGMKQIRKAHEEKELCWASLQPCLAYFSVAARERERRLS